MNRCFQYISIFIVSILVVGCGPDISFTEPQPSEVQVTNKFKNKFKGMYLCLEDSSILHIEKTSIIQRWHIEVETQKDSIVDIKSGIGNFQYDSDLEDLVITSNEDSTQFVIDYAKVLFDISSNHVLKYDKGIYFLNTENKDSSWEVEIVHFNENGVLLLKELNLNTEDLEKLKSLTAVVEERDVDGDVIEYKLQPTRKELKEIMKSGLFETGEEFVKIR